MQPFKYHVLVCKQQKPEGAPSCPGAGAGEVSAALEREIARAGLGDEVRLTGVDCLGLCGRGPNLVVYPGGAWYAGVKAEDVPEIVREHFQNGRPVERLVLRDPASIKQEILDHDQKAADMKEVTAKSGMLPEPLNSILRGFMESRAVLSAIELDLFSAVGAGAAASEVAAGIGSAVRSTEALLNALAAIGALEKRGGRFFNTEVTGRFFRRGSPDDSREAAMHTVHLWPRWSTLTEAVKAGTSVVPRAARGEDETRHFIAAMNQNAAARAGRIAGVLDLDGVTSVLDVGGGSGAYSIALARKKPDLHSTVFDLGTVTPLTEKYIAEAGLAGRIKTRPGDMLRDDLGAGYDLALVFAICHMWGPEENLLLFRRVFAALNPGGRIVIQDFILDEDKTSPRMAAVFALNMLVNTRMGSCYSASEHIGWLREAGFVEAEFKPLPGPAGLVVGVKRL